MPPSCRTCYPSLTWRGFHVTCLPALHCVPQCVTSAFYKFSLSFFQNSCSRSSRLAQQPKYTIKSIPSPFGILCQPSLFPVILHQVPGAYCSCYLSPTHLTSVTWCGRPSIIICIPSASHTWNSVTWTPSARLLSCTKPCMANG